MRKLGDSVDSLLSNILDSVSNTTPTNTETKEKYVLPVKVGIKNQPIDKGDKPWIVGNFAPGKYLNDTHPQGHEGVDLKAPAGTPIYPIGSGIVLDTANSGKGGINCKIAHENGAVISYYAHMKELKVKAQQNVLPTTIIGTVGDTGNAKGRGAHLHYEVKVDGSKVDPLSVVGKDVGSLSKMKKKSDEMFYDLVKMGGLLKYPQELFEEVWSFAEKIFTNVIYRVQLTEPKAKKLIQYLKNKYEIFNFDIFDTNLDHSIEFETNNGLNVLYINFLFGEKYLTGDYYNFDYNEDLNIIKHDINFHLGENEIYKVTSIEKFMKDLNGLRRTVEHECRHLQQEIYGTYMSVSDKIEEEFIQPPIGGLPPKQMRDNKRHSAWGNYLADKTNRNKDLLYEYRDIEFYPLLNTAIDVFIEQHAHLKNKSTDSEEEKKQKQVKLKISAKEFVGDPVDTNKTNSFFSTIKQKKNLKKWRQAVKEFYKAVFNE